MKSIFLLTATLLLQVYTIRGATTTGKLACSQIQIMCMTGCVRATGADGCPRCECGPTCDNVTCAYNEKCVLQDVACFVAPCFPQPQCVPNEEVTKEECPMIKCAPYCSPGKGPDGCPRCDCPQTKTCADITCAQNEECQMQVIFCFVAPCPPPYPRCILRRECTSTPNVKICEDISSRWAYNATTNQCYRFNYYGCIPSSNTFLTRKLCEDSCKYSDPICPAIGCSEKCITLTIPKKCPRCICPDPCKKIKCQENSVCKLREVTCKQAPCDPQPYCEPTTVCQEPICPTIRCAYGLKKDANGCKICQCETAPPATAK